MDLNQIGEFGFIRRIQKKFSSLLSHVPLGIGDDAAAILPSAGRYLLLTTDSLLEQVHFDLSFSNYFQIGYKAAAVNMSDIAAMGGSPSFFLISLGLTHRQKVEDLDRLYHGIAKGSREAGMGLIGGNTTSSNETFFISLTLLGEVPQKEMVTREGAAEGDALYVTGTLGSAAAGLELLKKGIDPKGFPKLVGRYQAPSARWREGRLLAKGKIPSAMIDLSDGLTSDLCRLAERSGVGIELEPARVPIDPSLRAYASKNGSDPLDYALHGGEDYELLFSVPGSRIKKLEKLIQAGSIVARRIGTIITKRSGIVARGADGRIKKIAPRGYDHFRKVL